ncbi:hypothetical protein CJ030_MR5G000447 [Morella rubra]|uniref:Uncharacterized protein n=1 Tax=Morella rubra TaxID=262757 RepID=A0A6A1VN98_9ROSI|nr:hypothetical protein CJ030_MR5G000447 [Morella rubra]
MASASIFASISILPSQNQILSFVSFPAFHSQIPQKSIALVAGAHRRTRRRPRRKLPERDMSVAVPMPGPSPSHRWDADDDPLLEFRNGSQGLKNELFSSHFFGNPLRKIHSAGVREQGTLGAG